MSMPHDLFGWAGNDILRKLKNRRILKIPQNRHTLPIFGIRSIHKKRLDPAIKSQDDKLWGRNDKFLCEVAI
jgi:hypothetical protein